MFIRHPNGDTEYVVACMSLELRGEVNVLHIYMVFKVMRFSESGRSSSHMAKWRKTDRKTDLEHSRQDATRKGDGKGAINET